MKGNKSPRFYRTAPTFPSVAGMSEGGQADEGSTWVCVQLLAVPTQRLVVTRMSHKVC